VTHGIQKMKEDASNERVVPGHGRGGQERQGSRVNDVIVRGVGLTDSTQIIDSTHSALVRSFVRRNGNGISKNCDAIKALPRELSIFKPTVEKMTLPAIPRTRRTHIE
jgi:hypothetical protein